MYPYNRRDHSSRRSSANWNFEEIGEYDSNLPDIELSDDSLPEFDSDSDSSSSFLSLSSSSYAVCLKSFKKSLHCLLFHFIPFGIRPFDNKIALSFSYWIRKWRYAMINKMGVKMIVYWNWRVAMNQ